jgi:hypothetical protein
MLSATAINDNTLEVKVVQPHFDDDLSRFKNAIPSADRRYLWWKEAWIVSNARDYLYIDWVAAALRILSKPKPGEIKLTQEKMF